MTPDAALAALVHGNKRFMSGRLTHHEQDLTVLKQHTVEKQEPFAAVLSCADSRVPVELVFDQSIGHIFVTRVAGNVIAPEIIASLEYGAAVLGTKVILVIGQQFLALRGLTPIEGVLRLGRHLNLNPHAKMLLSRSTQVVCDTRDL